MPFSLTESKPFRRSLLALLICALLFAQWMGFAHRVEHGDWKSFAAVTHADVADEQHTEPHEPSAEHACAAYDAATLGTPFAPAIPLLMPINDAYVRMAWTAFSCWDAPVVRHFSSRAPPVV